MTNAVRDSPVLGYKPDPFSQMNVPRVSILVAGTFVERRSIETHSLKVMANDETGIRLFSATEKDNTSSIPRIKMLIPGLLFQGKELTRPMGWVLHTCTYVGNLPIDRVKGGGEMKGGTGGAHFSLIFH